MMKCEELDRLIEESYKLREVLRGWEDDVKMTQRRPELLRKSSPTQKSTRETPRVSQKIFATYSRPRMQMTNHRLSSYVNRTKKTVNAR